MPQDGLDLDNPSVSPEQVQAELETVLRSATFERSERLQRFLRYICELTLKGEGHRNWSDDTWKTVLTKVTEFIGKRI